MCVFFEKKTNWYLEFFFLWTSKWSLITLLMRLYQWYKKIVGLCAIYSVVDRGSWYFFYPCKFWRCARDFPREYSLSPNQQQLDERIKSWLSGEFVCRKTVLSKNSHIHFAKSRLLCLHKCIDKDQNQNHRGRCLWNSWFQAEEWNQKNTNPNIKCLLGWYQL